MTCQSGCALRICSSVEITPSFDAISAAVVRIVKCYIADHRNIFGDETRRAQLIMVLRLFSEVGWPDAVRLLYELPELLR